MRGFIDDEPENPQAAIDAHVSLKLIPALQKNSAAAVAEWLRTYAELGDLRPARSLDYQKDTVLKALKSAGYTVAGMNGGAYPQNGDSNAIRNTIYTLKTFGTLPDPLMLRAKEGVLPKEEPSAGNSSKQPQQLVFRK